MQTKSKRIITSGCGLREGLFYDYYAKTNNVPLIAEDILKESTQNVLRLFSVNIEHNRHVAALALSMFDGWHGLHGLGKQYKKLLKTAALLHDIGITINYYFRPDPCGADALRRHRRLAQRHRQTVF